LALLILAAALAARRRVTLGAIGLPWVSALIQLGVVAYMFAPEPYRKPPVTAALFLYFILEALVWLRGREAEEPSAPDGTGARERRPPLFPPQRRRGLAEVSLAAAAVAIAFLLVAGPQVGSVPSESDSAQQEEAQTEQTVANDDAAAVEEPAPEAAPAAPDEPAKTESGAGESSEAAPQAVDRALEEAPAAEVAENAPAEAAPPAADPAPNDATNAETAKREPADDAPHVAAHAPVEPAQTSEPSPNVYTARAGDTFKSIAKRLYGATGKWRAIAELNPDVKRKRLRAGQIIKLPSAPTR
ncbi:MAG: LysM peptidoglycan-binding domain-containing protein, partial [Methylocystis sp.]|uniref:LysM peptidoglycan-binding domain-containing protein n=1 Tax=Methylocystis sp. TaxID=1911079 RepID=UPI003D0D95E0